MTQPHGLSDFSFSTCRASPDLRVLSVLMERRWVTDSQGIAF